MMKNELDGIVKKFTKECGISFRDKWPETGESVQLFSKYVIKFRTKLDNKTNFKLAERVYANMLTIYKNKREDTEKAKLKKDLKALEIVDDDDINKMCLSWGYFMGIHRTPPKVYNKEVRHAFFDLIFCLMDQNVKSDELYEKLDSFADIKHTIGPALLTGIASTIRPKEFMVYNKPSVNIFAKTKNYKHFKSLNMSKYREFNTLCREISKRANKSLNELDSISEWSR